MHVGVVVRPGALMRQTSLSRMMMVSLFLLACRVCSMMLWISAIYRVYKLLLLIHVVAYYFQTIHVRT